MTPLDKESVVQTAQIALAYLNDKRNATPNDMLEGIVSAKSLLRGIVAGNLVVCQVDAPPGHPGPTPVPKPTGKKPKASKAAKPKAAKKAA